MRLSAPSGERFTPTNLVCRGVCRADRPRPEPNLAALSPLSVTPVVPKSTGSIKAGIAGLIFEAVCDRILLMPRSAGLRRIEAVGFVARAVSAAAPGLHPFSAHEVVIQGLDFRGCGWPPGQPREGFGVLGAPELRRRRLVVPPVPDTVDVGGRLREHIPGRRKDGGHEDNQESRTGAYHGRLCSPGGERSG